MIPDLTDNEGFLRKMSPLFEHLDFLDRLLRDVFTVLFIHTNRWQTQLTRKGVTVQGKQGRWDLPVPTQNGSRETRLFRWWNPKREEVPKGSFYDVTPVRGPRPSRAVPTEVVGQGGLILQYGSTRPLRPWRYGKRSEFKEVKRTDLLRTTGRNGRVVIWLLGPR